MGIKKTNEEYKPVEGADSEKKKEGEEIEEAPVMSIDDRMSAMEETVAKIAKAVLKEDEPIEEEAEVAPMPMEEEKTKAEKEDMQEATVAAPANPKEPTEGVEKLPPAPAGETDETAQEETDKIDYEQKSIKKMAQTMGDVLKSYGFNKTVGNRATGHTDISKNKPEEPVDLGLDFLNKMRKGEMTLGQANQEIKGMINKGRDAALRKILGKEEVA